MNIPYTSEEVFLHQTSFKEAPTPGFSPRLRHLALTHFRTTSDSASVSFRRFLAPFSALASGVLALFLFFMPLTQAYQVDPASGTIVERIRGQEATLLQFEDTVRPGDILRTGAGQSRFAVHLGTATVDVFSHSQLHVLNSDEAALPLGLLTLSTQDTFTLRTPQGLLVLAPDSLARIEVSPLEDASVQIRRGAAKFVTSAGTLTLAPGRAVRLFPDTDVESLLPYFSEEVL